MPAENDLASLDRRYRDQASWTRTLRRKLLDDAVVGAGTRLLDIGAGTGAVADDILQTYSGAHVTAVDIDTPSLAYAREKVRSAALAAADALALPFRGAAFDVAFFHFVLLWLKRPVDALIEAARVTRRRGLVLAFAEPDHEARIDAPPIFEALGRKQTEALARQGADTRFGRQLGGCFEVAGLQSVRVGVLGGEWTRSGPTGIAPSEWRVLRTDLAGDLAAEELDRLETADRQASADGVRVLFVPTFYAVGQVP